MLCYALLCCVALRAYRALEVRSFCPGGETGGGRRRRRRSCRALGEEGEEEGATKGTGKAGASGGGTRKGVLVCVCVLSINA